MATTGYRGGERRRREASDVGGRVWGAVGGVLLVLVMSVVGVVLDGRMRVGSPVVLASLDMAMAVLAVAVAAVAAAHWRAVGRAHGLRVAVAASLLGIRAGVRLVGVADPVVGPADLVGFALALTAAVWIGRAIQGPEVDTRLGPVRELVLAALTVLGVLLLAVATEGLGLDGRTGTAARSAILALAWLGVGLAGIVRSLDRGWALLGWTAWAAIAFGVGGSARVVASLDDGTWGFVSGAMGAAGLLVAVVGATFALARVAMSHRGDLHGVMLDRAIQQDRELRERRRLTHEVRNAVWAIEGAASTLEKLDDRLGHEQGRRVQQAVHSGIDTLRDLVADPRAQRSRRFALDEVVADRVAAAEARGVQVQLGSSKRVEVVGRPAAAGRAIDNLLLNAMRHGGAGQEGHPLVVSVEGSDGQGTVRVADNGPGVPPAEREAIFGAGYQLDPQRKGDGLGLHVARDLVRAQDGDLVCEPRRGRGACFRLWLPRVLDPVGVPAAQEVDDGR